MSSTVLHKRSSVSGHVPAVTSLSAGELAINTGDGKLFIRTVQNDIKSFSNDEQQAFVLNATLSSIKPQYGNNESTQVFTVVLGGYENNVSGAGSTIVNGENNTIDGDFAFIGDGFNNNIDSGGDYSAILAGQNNYINHQNSFALGSNLSSHAANFTYVNNLSAAGKIYGDGSSLTGIVAGDTEATTLVRQQSANWGTGGAAQSIAFNEILNELSITSGNTISLSSLAGGSGEYLPLSGGTLIGTIVGNLSATGSFYGDGSNLTGIIAGDSEATTLVRSNSANWNSVYTSYNANSAFVIDVATIVQSNSAAWAIDTSIDTGVRALTSNWQDTYTIVQSNSAAWNTTTSYSILLGDNVTNPLTATHNLNTKDIIFSVREVATNKIIQAAGRTVDNNNLELTFNSTPTINQYDLTVLCNGGVIGTGGGTTNAFALVKVTSTSYVQVDTYTHNLYDDAAAGGQMLVYLLPPANHIGVTQHKKIGSTANVVLSAPNGATIDGQPTYTLMNQYEAVGLYTDGNNYFIE
jgi:hypothetical protein